MGTQCCAQCSEVLGCVGWTFHPNSKSGRDCFIKKKMGKSYADTHCVSGGGPPAPPSPPSPPPAPSGGMMLFNVMADPGEHNDVAKDHPDIVHRLSKVLNDMRATAV